MNKRDPGFSPRGPFGPALMAVFLATGCSSSGSGGAMAVPEPPTDVQATAGAAAVTLAWTAVQGASGYTVYWDTVAGVAPGSSTAVPVTGSPFVHSGLPAGVEHYYVVTARNGAGESPPSPERSAMPASASADPYAPTWADQQPQQTLTIDHDGALSNGANGDRLRQAIQALQPGDRLEIGSGTWSVDVWFTIDLQGTADDPIWIVAQAGATPVLTRVDQQQNAVNVGVGTTARYLCLRGLEITGGDTGVKLYSCEDVWIDRCHVHHVGGVGIAANSADTRRLHLSRNEIHDTNGHGEGMYLGANNSQWVMSDSVVAQNHVHDCGGSQGDGIEVKQGSYGNWIVDNHVHDCNYPCILVYGTDGNPVNVVERNVCYRSNDNAMQIQGEAIVRNNLVIGGANAFASHDHQGQSRDLTFVHNTVVNTGTGANLSSWTDRPGMVFANNIVYSQSGTAIRFSGGASGVTVSGNVVVGSVSGAGAGYLPGNGLQDFADMSWDGVRRDAHLAAGAPAIGAGDPAWGVAIDLSGQARQLPLDTGCYDAQ